jgi:hypothetical protein
MAVAVTRYFENIRYLNTLFQTFITDPTADFTANSPEGTVL